MAGILWKMGVGDVLKAANIIFLLFTLSIAESSLISLRMRAAAELSRCVVENMWSGVSQTWHRNHPEVLLKSNSDSLWLGWGLRFWISNCQSRLQRSREIYHLAQDHCCCETEKKHNLALKWLQLPYPFISVAKIQ